MKNSNLSIGRITMNLINEEIDEWEIGWYLLRNYWKNGYITERVNEIFNFAFTKLKVHKIVAFTNYENKNSENVMINVGMKKDGELRESKLLNKVWKNELIYSIINHEYGK